MHDDPPFKGPGDTSSGIHRIIEPAPDAAQTEPATNSPAAADGQGFQASANADGLSVLPAEAGASEPGLSEWANLARSDSRFVPIVDPSAETVAEEMPPLPLTAMIPDGTRDTARGSSRSGRRSLLLIALISYASAATLALLYLTLAMSRARPHALESLPDVPPLDVEHGEVMKLAPADADLPPGHRLGFGESRRFGNILVEPLRAVVEPVQFEHFSGGTEVQKPATAPVLKLWLRFTNVSEDQTIAPLDPELVFRRAVLDVGPRANQFVRRIADENTDGPQVLLYDHPISSEWDLQSQQLRKRLAPGESLETYLPSGADGAALSGPLVWRVHFRKGYSSGGNGVTTLVDVEFDAPASPPAAPAAG